MLHSLESPTLRITANTTGAELSSIFSKKTQTEYLWQGDPAHWGSRAPVLFPTIGLLRNGSYTHEGNSYQLPKHGFVRHADFNSKHEPNKLVYEYADNPSTRAVYPFEFIFTVTFALDGNTICVKNHVENKGNDSMFFSVGAHEAYHCPWNADESFEDYCISFGENERKALSNNEKLESHAINLKTGLLSGETFPVPLTDHNELPLKHSLFEKDALVFKNINSKKVVIRSRKNPAAIEITYDAPHLGIWTKVGAPFICIEPWCGLPDFDDSNGIFADKDGNIKLNKGETFTFTHAITVNEK